MSQYQYNEGWAISAPRITWAVQRLIVGTALIFALQLVWDPFEAYLLRVQGWIPDSFDRFFSFQMVSFAHGYLWQPFTYMFLHANLMHLAMNMMMLFFFGPDIERVLGTRQFFRFYLVCGAVAVMATYIPYSVQYLIHGPGPGDSSVLGASGAVMALLVAFAMTDPERQFFLFPLPVPVNARLLVVIVVVMNMISGLQEGGVSTSTHFGGMAAGYAYMKLLPLINRWKSSRRHQGGSGGAKSEFDRIGDAVDNIFRFNERKKPR